METPTGILFLSSRRLWWGGVVISSTVTAAGFALCPFMAARFTATTLGYSFPVIALAGLLGMALCTAPETGALAWLSARAWLLGTVATAAFVTGASPAWWIVGILAAALYLISIARKVSAVNA